MDKDCSNNPIPGLSWIGLKVGLLLGLLVLNACGYQDSFSPHFMPSPTTANMPPDNNVVPQVIPADLLGYASPTSMPAASVELSQTPTLTPAANAFPDSLPLPPGWIWYRSPDLPYLMAYPQSWMLQRNPRETGVGVRERVSFRSPETGSEVNVDIWEVTTSDFDLLDWINSNPERVLYDVLEEPVSYNATILGQPAVFHSHPAGWGTRDMAFLLFAVAEYRFRIFFNSATTPVTEAEPYVYLYMLESLSLSGHAANGISIPTGWEKGAGLITIIDPPKPAPADLPLDEQQTYQHGLTGTVENWNDTPGVIHFTLITNGGNNYAIYAEPFRVHFHGLPIDYKYNVYIPRPRDGDRVWVAGQPLASGEMLAEYIAVEVNGEWQTWFHKSLFNVFANEFNPVFLANYSGDESFNVWLQGQFEAVLPFLVDETGSPIEPDDWSQYLKQESLAFGVLQVNQEMKVELHNLYVQDGGCTLSHTREYCDSWQQLYPPIPMQKLITATVLESIPETQTIVLQQPVKGIISITLSPNGHLLAGSGETIAWESLTTGMTIQASGEIGAGGTFIAEEIRVQ